MCIADRFGFPFLAVLASGHINLSWLPASIRFFLLNCNVLGTFPVLPYHVNKIVILRDRQTDLKAGRQADRDIYRQLGCWWLYCFLVFRATWSSSCWPRAVTTAGEEQECPPWPSVRRWAWDSRWRPAWRLWLPRDLCTETWQLATCSSLHGCSSKWRDRRCVAMFMPVNIILCTSVLSHCDGWPLRQCWRRMRGAVQETCGLTVCSCGKWCSWQTCPTGCWVTRKCCELCSMGKLPWSWANSTLPQWWPCCSDVQLISHLSDPPSPRSTPSCPWLAVTSYDTVQGTNCLDPSW